MTAPPHPAGILGFGAYIPRSRLQRSSILAAHAWYAPGSRSPNTGERSFANWDEDSITLAVEAARDSLWEVKRGGIGCLTFATTTAPFADRQNSVLIKEALNLPDTCTAMDVGGGMRAGTTALLQALRTAYDSAGVQPHIRPSIQLCVAAEKRKALPASAAELTNGDGAAAFIIGHGEPLATLLGWHSISVDFVDHFRSSDSPFDYTWESRWIRDEGYNKLAATALRDALKSFSMDGADLDHFVCAIPAEGIAKSLAKTAGIRPEAISDGLTHVLGSCGSAYPLVMLAHVLERARPGERILVLSFGQGCDILLLQATDAIGRKSTRHDPLAQQGVSGWLARRKPEDNYLKYLALAGHVMLDRGMRAELDQKQSLSALYRHRKTVLALLGSRRRDTGMVQFPSSMIGVDGTLADPETHEEYALAERAATILTHATDYLAFTPEPPSCYGMIEFDGGGRMAVDFTDIGPEPLCVGGRVRMMFRIKAVDERRHFTKYFWKAVPVGER